MTEEQIEQRRTDMERLQHYLEAARADDAGRLPAERVLAEALGITRSRLRHSLQKLEDDGLIWRHVGKGTYYGNRPRPKAPKPVSLLDITNPMEIMEARLSLEPELARLAAYRSTARDFAAMETCVNRMWATASNWNAWQRLDIEFHRMVAKAAQNELMLVMSDMIADLHQIWGRLREGSGIAGRVEKTTQEHVEILKALRDRDPDGAARAMRQHLQRVREILLERRA